MPKQYMVESDYKNPDLFIQRLKRWNCQYEQAIEQLHRDIKELTDLNHGKLQGSPDDLPKGE